MTYNDEQFQPEIVDEQLAHLSQQSLATDGTQPAWDNAENRRVIQHLRDSYNETPTEDIHSLARAWEHVAQHSNIQKETFMPELQQEEDIQSSPTFLPPRRTTIPQRIGLLVAVLFLIALVGSLIVVLDMTHKAGLSNNHLTIKTTPKVAATHTPHYTQMYIYAVSYQAAYKLDSRNGHILWSNPLGKLIPEPPPVVADGIVYIEQNTGQHSNMLYALSAATGKILWRYTISNDILVEPVVANNVVYVSTTYHSSLYALNTANGHLLWTYTVGYALYNIMISEGILYGTAMGYMGQFSGVTYALNATTGTQLWRLQNTQEMIYITQVINGIAYGYSVRDNKNVNPPVRYSYIYALNAHNGAQLWRSHIINEYMSGPPVVANGVIYFATDELGTVGPLVYAMNTTNGAIIWTKKVGGPVDAPLLVLDGAIYINVSPGNNQTSSPIVALNASDGSMRWSHQLVNNFYMFGSALNIVNGTLYIVTEDSIVHILSLTGGNEIRRFTLPGVINMYYSNMLTFAP